MLHAVKRVKIQVLMLDVHIRIVYTIASILFLIARLFRFEPKRALRLCDRKKKDDLETGSIYSYIQDEDILDFAPFKTG